MFHMSQIHSGSSYFICTLTLGLASGSLVLILVPDVTEAGGKFVSGYLLCLCCLSCVTEPDPLGYGYFQGQ